MMKGAMVGAVCALGLATVASADIVDQEQSLVVEWFSTVSTGGSWSPVQSFKPAASNVSGGGIWMAESWSGSGDMEIGIFTSEPYSSGASPFASAVVSATSGPGFGGWVDAFWSPAAVTPGDTYYLGYRMVSGSQVGVTYGGSGDPYAGGSAWYNGFDYGPFGYDLTFRSWTSDVPAPGSLALLGLGGLAAARRRRA